VKPELRRRVARLEEAVSQGSNAVDPAELKSWSYIREAFEDSYDSLRIDVLRTRHDPEPAWWNPVLLVPTILDHSPGSSAWVEACDPLRRLAEADPWTVRMGNHSAHDINVARVWWWWLTQHYQRGDHLSGGQKRTEPDTKQSVPDPA